MSTGYRLGLIGDLHCGSRYALVPPKWWAQDLAVVPSATIMRLMWSYWEHFCANCPRLDCLIVNGDLIEGESPSKKDAMDAITDNPMAQGEMVEYALGRLLDKAKPRELWIVRGTPYHDGKHFETLEAVARNLGAHPYTPGRYTGSSLQGTWRGIDLNIAHHITGMSQYPGTATTREALFAAAAEHLARTNPADLIVRSHVHLHSIGYAYGKWVVQLPAWKVVNPWAEKGVGFYKANLLSDLGAVIVRTDGKGEVAFDNKTFAYENFKPTFRDLNPREAGPAGRARAGRTHRDDAGRAGQRRPNRKKR